jgi:hypothetical protein
MEIILKQRVLGQYLLCLCLEFCGLCLTCGIATLIVKGGITLELLAAKPQNMQFHEVKYNYVFKYYIQTVCASMNVVNYKLTNMKVVRSII